MTEYYYTRTGQRHSVWKGSQNSAFESEYAQILSKPQWQDEALCQGKDPDQWSPDQDDDPWTKKAKLMQGRVTCLACPVRGQCQQWSTQEDRTWTMYAGQWPSQYKHLAP